MIKNDEWQICEKRWLFGYLTSLSQLTEIIQQKIGREDDCKPRIGTEAETKFKLCTTIRMHTQENHEETGMN
jgi:hypothetical protein